MSKKESSNLITSWETDPKMSEFQREKSRIIEEEYLRERFKKQEYNLEKNKDTYGDRKFVLYHGSLYEIIYETKDCFVIVSPNGKMATIERLSVNFKEGSRVGTYSK
jgi:hypothetical protein